jgi:hypothetical protein
MRSTFDEVDVYWTVVYAVVPHYVMQIARQRTSQLYAGRAAADYNVIEVGLVLVGNLLVQVPF